jgi:hypothetical protein
MSLKLECPQISNGLNADCAFEKRHFSSAPSYAALLLSILLSWNATGHKYAHALRRNKWTIHMDQH